MRRFAALVGALFVLASGTESQAQYTRFDHPVMEGAIVDWCSTWATNCGAGGAHLYCQRMGYANAGDWSTYHPGRTWVIGSIRHCVGDFCVGFNHVSCVGATLRRFDHPVMNGAIVDWCSTWATNCGVGGANQFCQWHGYARATEWGTYHPGRTWVIGSNQFCDGGFCVGFSHVTCSR